MTEVHTFHCDECGTDLTWTGSQIDYRIHVEIQRIPATPGVVTALFVDPLMEKKLHFCGMTCLSDYFEKREKNARQTTS